MQKWKVLAMLTLVAWFGSVSVGEQPKPPSNTPPVPPNPRAAGDLPLPPANDQGGQVGSAGRVALVIGNSKYGGDAQLANPANDADTVASALRELNFTVIKKTDVDKTQFEDALLDFHRKLPKGGLGLFYYAGHGVQVEGNNYLVPIGARMREEFEVKRQCLEVNQVMDAMAESETNLKVLILDCCRNNPFKRSWKRSLGDHGLKAIENVPDGTIVAFSTAAGKTADDGEGKNSPYAQHLVAALRSKPAGGLELVDVFRESSRNVKHATGQVPWLNMEASLDKYYLRLPNNSNPNETVPIPADEFKSLFNGKDLTGWQTHDSQRGNWRVQDGILVGMSPPISHLYTVRQDFSDFHLRVEARINDGGNSGVYFRSNFGPSRPAAAPLSPLGYEAQIYTSDNINKTGGLFAFGASGSEFLGNPTQATQWFTMEVIAEGKHVVVKVDGRTTYDFVDDQNLQQKGCIALQAWREPTVAEFRKIEIKELKAK